tara:strand:- start:1234 stop:1464 length:231 start_codon:yes stop_codon:yes gene_type:complete
MELIDYYVTVDFLHKPTYRTQVKSVNSCQAVMSAVAKSPYPANTMYRNATSKAITMTERNRQIREHHKEEAESGNI